jgi:hypothetical protein
VALSARRRRRGLGDFAGEHDRTPVPDVAPVSVEAVQSLTGGPH